MLVPVFDIGFKVAGGLENGKVSLWLREEIVVLGLCEWVLISISVILTTFQVPGRWATQF